MRFLLAVTVVFLGLGAAAPPAVAPMGLDGLVEALAEHSVVVIDRQDARMASPPGVSARPERCEQWTTLRSARLLACTYPDTFQARQAAWRQSGPSAAQRYFHRGTVVVRTPAGTNPLLRDALSAVMTEE